MYASDSSMMTGLVTRPWSPNCFVGRWLGLGVSSLSYSVLWHLCPHPPETRSLSCNLRLFKNVFRHCYMSPNGVHGTAQRSAGVDDCVRESGAETCSSRTLPRHTGSAARWHAESMIRKPHMLRVYLNLSFPCYSFLNMLSQDVRVIVSLGLS